MTELLADPSVKTPEQIAAAFKAYDAIRRPRSQKVVTTSHENGDLLCLCYEGVGDDPEKLKTMFQERYSWLWDLDVQEQVENARKVMLDLLKGGK